MSCSPCVECVQDELAAIEPFIIIDTIAIAFEIRIN
jgi:hypothetical protein